MSGAAAGYPGGPRRLSATDGRAHQVLGLGLALACPVVTFVGAVSYGARGPEAFVVAVVVHVALVGYLVWLVAAWLRPARRPGAADLALAWLPLLLMGATTWLLREVAYSYGIRGSAVPRVRMGIAFPADVAYLGALAAVALSGLVALLLLAALVRARLRLTPRP